VYHLHFKTAGRIGLLFWTVLPLFAADVPAYVAGRLLVGLKEGVEAGRLNRTLQLHDARMRKMLPQPGAGILDIPEEYSGAILLSLRNSGLFRYVERDYYAHISASPNDPKYPSQWYLPKIQAPDAWSITTGTSEVLVAAIDSGVEASHPDLKSRLTSGWNFLTGDSNTGDEVGHGTGVAGIIAAASDNGVGVAGLNWSARVLPLVVVGMSESATYSDIASAIVYAADHGARIVNVSLGGANSSVTLQTAVDYAWNRGVLIFAAAMNATSSTRNYPAACDHVAAIAATDGADNLAFFSNYGDWITLSAPGTSILTTAIGSGYGYENGTSFSSPIAAGVAALVLAVDPALSNTDVLDILKSTADDLGEPGRDNRFGWGRINAYRAVAAAYRLAHPQTRLAPPLEASRPVLVP
jgi:thermitase